MIHIMLSAFYHYLVLTWMVVWFLIRWDRTIDNDDADNSEYYLLEFFERNYYAKVSSTINWKGRYPSPLSSKWLHPIMDGYGSSYVIIVDTSSHVRLRSLFQHLCLPYNHQLHGDSVIPNEDQPPLQFDWW